MEKKRSPFAAWKIVIPVFLFLGGSFSSLCLAKPADFLRIKYAFSFAVCHAYCLGEMTIDGRQVTFKKASRLPKPLFPEISKKGSLSDDEWKELNFLLKTTRFERIKGYYGCPDCYGQGSLKLKVETAKIDKDVNMDYKNYPTELANLAKFLDNLWDRMDQEPEPAQQ